MNSSFDSAELSVAELSAGSGSEPPPFTVAVAVFESVPVAEGDTVQVGGVGRRAADRQVGGSLTLPTTGPAVQEPPPAPTQVVAQLVSVAGKRSRTVTVGAALGPAFVTTIV